MRNYYYGWGQISDCIINEVSQGYIRVCVCPCECECECVGVGVSGCVCVFVCMFLSGGLCQGYDRGIRR